MAVKERSGGDAVPPFLEVAGHAVRWRLLRELARSGACVIFISHRTTSGGCERLGWPW